MEEQHIRNIHSLTIQNAVLFFVAIGVFIFGILLVSRAIFAEENTAIGDEILNITDDINAKKDEAAKLKKQSAEYERTIELRRKEAVSLENELAILQNQIEKTQIDIEATGADIEATGLEIKKTEDEIRVKEEDVAQKKEILSEYLRQIDQSDRVDYLRVLLMNDSFSEFFEQIQYLKGVQEELRGVLKDVIALKDQLEEKKKKLVRENNDLEKLKISLENKQGELKERGIFKESLLDQTRNSEVKYQQLLSQLRREQQSVEGEISSLEERVRAKLKETDAQFSDTGEVLLSWPVPFKGITAYFHDPSYPFRNIFEHPAVDLRASQGTPIKAAAPGYVAKAKNAGMGYSYIMLIHSGGISTVYGHVSRISVSNDQYVARGDIIGYSGGAPGTPGAGPFTTGSHLHFETRLNGIPVNPLDYLIDL